MDMTRVKLLAAFQVLSLPSGVLGVKHKRAREVIRELAGVEPVGTTPAGLSLEGYLEWLAEHHREVTP